MTIEEREKCAWLFHIFTEETIEPHKWNDKSAEALFEMIREIKHCSTGLAFIPTVSPKNNNPASFLASYVFDVVKKLVKLKGSETTAIKICRDTAIIRGWPQKIKLASMGLWVD